ncbi:3-oxoacyl-ACP synthase III family protein [Actinoplanes sp. NPDC051859]|uniref:3-oxoacyl-ACP synthase III family protein n=1 Tax=Actinoplanes sp. NPDC051859 TaxID=3363909 RepID=UPI0037966C40
MIGIVEFEVRLPRSQVTVDQLSTASGLGLADIRTVTRCDSFPVLSPEEPVWEAACDAAAAVLGRVAVPRTAIDCVIYAGSGVWDRPFWSPAAKVAHELGIDDAHCFEVTNFCNSGAAAIQLACDKVELGRAAYVLVLLGDQLSRMVDHHDPESKALFNFGDAGAAVLIGANGCTFAHLRSTMRTDPSWVDYYFGEPGDGHVLIRRGTHRAGLADAYVENFVALTDRTLRAVHRGRDEIAYLLVNHGDEKIHRRLMRALDLPDQRSVFNYDRLGHMGGADTLIALQDLVTTRKLRTGDLILLATSAMGFSWGVTALEYQR